MTDGDHRNGPRQTPRQRGLVPRGVGEAHAEQHSGEPTRTTTEPEHLRWDNLMEEVAARENIAKAMKRVVANHGSAGADGMTVEELPTHLERYGDLLQEQLLAGSYEPRPVRRVTIPKPDGGERELGIPTVMDRLVQQAILQVLGPRFEPSFSKHSHGFRPGHSAHDAVLEAHGYVQEGYTWVVDVDLERFFDRVNHDVLMGRLAKRITDRRMLRIIRRFLSAGMMDNGVVSDREEGTPQGGPLSPLLANVLLDEVDKSLEARGHRFVRYADDCNVYVRSQRAGERVLESMRRDLSRLRLRVNEAKTAVDRPWNRSFLGFTFTRGRDPRRRASAGALEKVEDRIRELTKRSRGVSVSRVIEDVRVYLRGWFQYFRLCQVPTPRRTLASWIRARLRLYQITRWRSGPTAHRALRAMGASEEPAAYTAYLRRHRWRAAHSKGANQAMSTAYFDRQGIPRLV